MSKEPKLDLVEGKIMKLDPTKRYILIFPKDIDPETLRKMSHYMSTIGIKGIFVTTDVDKVKVIETEKKKESLIKRIMQ